MPADASPPAVKNVWILIVGIGVKNFTLNLQLLPISHVLSPALGRGARKRRAGEESETSPSADRSLGGGKENGRERLNSLFTPTRHEIITPIINVYSL